MGNNITYCNIDILNLIINVETLQLRNLIKFISISKFFRNNFINPQYWQKITDTDKIITNFIDHILKHKNDCIYPINNIREIYEIYYLGSNDILDEYEYDHYKYDVILNRKINFNPLYEERPYVIDRANINEFYKLFKNYKYMQLLNGWPPNIHGDNCDTIYVHHSDIMSTQNVISRIVPDIRRIIAFSKGFWDLDNPLDVLFLSVTLDPPFIVKNSKIKNIILRGFDADAGILFSCPKLYNLNKYLPPYIVKLWIPFFECDKKCMTVFSKLPNLKLLAVEIDSSKWNHDIEIDITLNILVLYIVMRNTTILTNDLLLQINLPNVKRVDINYKSHLHQYNKFALYAKNAEECNFNRIHTIHCSVHIDNCRKLWVHAVKTQLQIFSKYVQEIVVNKFIITISRSQQYSIKNYIFLINFENFGVIQSFSTPAHVHHQVKIDEEINHCFYKVSDESDFHDSGEDVWNDEDW